jgi:hypothetical protein
MPVVNGIKGAAVEGDAGCGLRHGLVESDW